MPIRCSILLSAILISLLLASSASAQYRFDSWTNENGLPQNSVSSLRADARRVSLDRHVRRTRALRRRQVHGCRGRKAPRGSRSVRIHALLEDRAGALWIATEGGGLTRYADGTFKTYTTKDGLPTDSISFVTEDSRRRIWLATVEGLVRFEDGRFTTFTTRDGMPANPVSQIVEDRQGNLWLGTRGGLVRFTDGRFTTFTTRDGLPDNLVHAILEGRDGSVWVGTGAGGVARLRSGHVTTFTTADGLPSNTVRDLLEDRAGGLWVGTDQGVARLEPATALDQTTNGVPRPRRFTAYTTRDGLSDNVVRSLLEDREGNVWVGTNTGGLNRLKRKQVTAFGRPDGLPATASSRSPRMPTGHSGSA